MAYHGKRNSRRSWECRICEHENRGDHHKCWNCGKPRYMPLKQEKAIRALK